MGESASNLAMGQTIASTWKSVMDAGWSLRSNQSEWNLRRKDFDDTLITPQGSIGAFARKGSFCPHVESASLASYAWIGLHDSGKLPPDQLAFRSTSSTASGCLAITASSSC